MLPKIYKVIYVRLSIRLLYNGMIDLSRVNNHLNIDSFIIQNSWSRNLWATKWNRSIYNIS